VLRSARRLRRRISASTTTKDPAIMHQLSTPSAPHVLDAAAAETASVTAASLQKRAVQIGSAVSIKHLVKAVCFACAADGCSLLSKLIKYVWYTFGDSCILVGNCNVQRCTSCLEQAMEQSECYLCISFEAAVAGPGRSRLATIAEFNGLCAATTVTTRMPPQKRLLVPVPSPTRLAYDSFFSS